MSDDDSTRLRSDILSLVAAAEGIAIPQLATRLDAYFASDRSEAEVDGYRLSQRPFKKLRDEIVPVSQFLTARGLPGRVRFPLDSNIPDAWYLADGADPVGIEVTTALGRAANAVSEQLVKEGVSGGRLGFVQNSAPKATFDRVRQRSQVMFTSAQWSNAVRRGIFERIRAKGDKPEYDGMILLISMALGGFPTRLWSPISEDLTGSAAQSVFREIWVLDTEGQERRQFCLKA